MFTDYFSPGVSSHLPAGYGDGLNLTSSFCCLLAPGGTLTLGAAHKLAHGAVEVLPDTTLPGWITLFRLWRREWSEEEVTSLVCVEGEMVTWWWQDWDIERCTLLPEPSFTCGESPKESLRFHSGDMLWCGQVIEHCLVSDRQSGHSTRWICCSPFSGVIKVIRSCKWPQKWRDNG